MGNPAGVWKIPTVVFLKGTLDDVCSFLKMFAIFQNNLRVRKKQFQKMETSPMHIDVIPTTGTEMNLEMANIKIELMRSEDLNIRHESIELLDSIAGLLDENAIVSHLLPYVKMLLDDEEDSILNVIAFKIGQIVNGKNKKVMEYGITILEAILDTESLLVRKKCLECLADICIPLSDEDIKSLLEPLFIRLIQSPHFTCRIVASSVMLALFGVSDNEKGINKKLTAADITKFTNIYWDLLQDPIALVRLEAVKNFPELVQKLESKFLIQNLVPKLDLLINEEQDSIRYNLVSLIVTLSSKIADPELRETKFGPLFLKLGEDPSWRVRYIVATRYVDFSKTLTPKYVKDNLIDLFVLLVKDLEPEVRASIGQQISGFGNVIGNELALKHLSNCIQLLMEDTSSQVREKLAGYVTLLAPVFGKDKTIESLLPIFVKLLKDEVPEVRLKLISRLEQVNLVIGVQILAENLLPAILELAADTNWRIRLAVIDEIPALAQHLGKDFFGEKLSLVCTSLWLTDKVCQVREAALKTFPYLIESFGEEWTTKYLLVQLKALVASENYLYRLTAIKANSIILPCIKQKDLLEEVWSNFITLLDDPVPNVKFNVSKELFLLSKSFNWLSISDLVCQDKLGGIKSRLSKLATDEDNDVKYYSGLALNKF